MNKRYTLLALLPLVALLATAAVLKQNNAIQIESRSAGEVKLTGRTIGAVQTGNWLQFSDSAGTKFALPASGLVPLAYGGTAASTPKGARTSLGLPEGATNASMPLLASTTAKEGRTALGLPEGSTNASMPLLASTTAKEGRTALELPEGLTNAAMPLLSATSATEGRTALELPEGLTNAFPATLTGAKAARTAMELPESVTNSALALVTGDYNIIVAGLTTNKFQFSLGVLTNVMVGVND